MGKTYKYEEGDYADVKKNKFKFRRKKRLEKEQHKFEEKTEEEKNA